MKDSVIIVVADEKYLPYAKATLVNCVRQGNWQGDFCLVLPPEVDATDLRNRGVYVMYDSRQTFYRKFAIFDPFFRQWKTALYLDADTLVQDDINDLPSEVTNNEIFGEAIIFDLQHAFTHWDWFLDKPRHFQKNRRMFGNLWEKYDLSRPQINTAVLLWRPEAVSTDAVQQLDSMRQYLAPINYHVMHGTDQPVINLALYDQLRPIRDGLFRYWNLTTPQTKIVHYCSGYAPWIDKPHPLQDAYANERLGRPCHEVYLENVSLFGETFPQKDTLCSLLP